MGKTSITTAITDGQRKQYKRFVEDAADRALVETGLNKDGIQTLIGRGGEFQDRIVTAIRELSLSNQFADEETGSSYGYLSGYKPGVMDIDRQIEELRNKLFPGLGDANPEYLEKVKSGVVPLPAYAEKWFAIPNWMKNPQIFGANYSQAVQRVLDKIRETREGKFYNYYEGEIDEKHIRQSARTKKFFEDLAETQGNPDILIVPAQFGIRFPQGDGTHIVASVRRARVKFISNESGLGAFAVVIMILTHPERLMSYNDLWIDCAGDEWSCEADGVFGSAPILDFSDDGVEFDTCEVGYVSEGYSSASGFLPVPLPQ